MKIVVIIPTYNEKANMERMIPILLGEVFPKITNNQMEILVADDLSPDGTGDVVRKYMLQYKNLQLLEGKKEGLGAAYVRAMHYAMDTMHADAVVEFDADFQHDPNDIPKLVAAYDEGYDYVIGSRYVPGGAIPKEWGFHRKFLSYFGSLFARVVWLKMYVHDMTSGYKLTKTEYLRKVDLDHLLSKYYAYKLHIIHDILNLKVKVKEVPIIFYERKEGSSKITRKDLFDSFYVVVRLRLRDSKRFVKFLIVGGTGFIVQLLTQELTIRLGFTFFLAAGISVFLDQFFQHQDVSTLSQAIGVGFGAEAAILSNFIFNNFWTFQDTRKLKEKSPFIIRLAKFNLTSLGAIFLQAFSVWLGIKFLGSNVILMSYEMPTRIVVLIPIIVAIVIPLNYLIYNKIIWKTQYLKNGKATEA
jgi:dolichol-phosphate mannosyltransferase